MGRIVVSEVSGASPEVLFQQAIEAESYSRLVPALGPIGIIEQSEDGLFVKARWTFHIRAMRVTRDVEWIQDATWDPEKCECRFALAPEYTGNLSSMQGLWTFRPHERGAETTMDVNVGIKDNVLPPRLAGMADFAVKRLNEELLRAIAREAEIRQNTLSA